VISFANAILAAAVAIVPPRLAASVASAIAAQWAADTSAIRLEWGVIPSAAELSDSTPFRLTGKGGDGWFVALFQPRNKSAVAVRVRAGVSDTIALAARPLPAGSALAAGDVRFATGVRWGTPIADFLPADGWVTRRALAAGDELTPATVMAPQLVKSGDAVRVEWQRGAVTVALDGIALASGALGETVSVRLAQRGGQRRGKVTASGSVRLES
jgi:flagella basal body P-ring formation protein FlgA